MRPLYAPHDGANRGWLCLGENGGACDQACLFCYYRHCPSKRWHSLDTLIAAANRIRHYYGHKFCTLSGGEPTLYPHLTKLIEHCQRIGLSPLINTHGGHATAEYVKHVEDAGVTHWIFSLEGCGASHDAVTGTPGAWEKVSANILHPKMPVMVNTTICTLNLQDVLTLGQWLVDHKPPTVWFLMNFLPFGWQGKDVDFEVTLRAAAPILASAIELGERHGWEVNVQYYPHCVAAQHGFAENVLGFYQGQYSPWDWDILATNRTTREAIQAAGGVNEARRLAIDGIVHHRLNDVCRGCRNRAICEGVHEDYQKRHGLGELRPQPGELVDDVQYFERGGAW